MTDATQTPVSLTEDSRTVYQDADALKKAECRAGAVYQINEHFPRKGWIGALVMVTEPKPWGIQGFVSHLKTHDEQSHAYIRLEWQHIDFVGHAPLQLGEPSNG